MSISVNFAEAQLASMALAQVGNPQRQEGLRTSKNLCQFQDDEAELLTRCFLKPFKSLDMHQLEHPEDVSENPLYQAASDIFDKPSNLVEYSAEIAKHLYASSNHPNIKSGDLCVAHLINVFVDGEANEAISIIKSESKVPFLQITASGEDLQLTTQQGIYPDKIDKGCLIVNTRRDEGYAVYLFDKSGDAQFWRCEFVSASPVQDKDYLTRRYSEMCVAFANDTDGLEEGMKEERVDVARKAVSYMAEADTFDMQDFNQVALAKPKVAEDFQTFKESYEAEKIGTPLQESFEVSKKEAKKAERKINSRLQLDTGVDLKFSTGFQKTADQFMEKGFDEDKQMKYVKIYYHTEG